MEEMVIDPVDFDKYFRDVRRFDPEPGDIMAKFTAAADLVDEGPPFMKRDLLDLLVRVENGGKSAFKVLTKMGCARDRDAVRVLREMAEDLASGMSREEVLSKPYRFVCEMFFYCKREHLPHSPHWEAIPLVDASKWENFEEVISQIEASDLDQKQ